MKKNKLFEQKHVFSWINTENGDQTWNQGRILSQSAKTVSEKMAERALRSGVEWWRVGQHTG